MATTHGLSQVDLEESSIEKSVAEMRQCETDVAELEAKLSQTQNELDNARLRLAATKRAIEWKRLMAQTESDPVISKLGADIEIAAEVFRHSLVAPTDYDDKDISYSDTDDYADLTGIEGVFEEATDEVQALLQSNSAKSTSSLSRRSSSTSPKLAPKTSETEKQRPVSVAAPDQRDQKAAARHKALLLLLVVSLHAGRLSEMCGVDAIRDPANRPTSDLDEIGDSVASQWHWALKESNVLTAAERELWQHIVSTFLGPRFDPSVSN